MRYINAMVFMTLFIQSPSTAHAEPIFVLACKQKNPITDLNKLQHFNHKLDLLKKFLNEQECSRGFIEKSTYRDNVMYGITPVPTYLLKKGAKYEDALGLYISDNEKLLKNAHSRYVISWCDLGAVDNTLNGFKCKSLIPREKR
jgi:hypothetical protein